MDNRSLLEKADLALADLTTGGGILQPAQAQTFMRLLIKQSVLLQLATVVPMAAPKQQIAKIRFGSRVLRPGTEATALPAVDRVKPNLSQIELDAKLFKGEVQVSDEVLEDSIERGALQQTLMEMLAEAISRDMEEVLINGDTASSDPFLATMDGLLKQATANVVDAAGEPISKELLRDMLKALPSEYLRSRSSMRFLTSIDAEIDYRNSLTERATVAGDRFLETDAPAMYSGVPVQQVPLFPENLAPGNRTAILLCDPKIINIGIWRQIRIESMREISEGILKIVATLRFDAKFAEQSAVVKAINVQL